MLDDANKEAPEASTLWLAIGLGAFSVFASFFLAIYFASANPPGEAVAHDKQAYETTKKVAR